ncbi:MAG: DUF192 domain-containing protein [Acidimicrobiia bacterium]
MGDAELTVAVADTGGERTQGLKGETALPAGIDGMLFVFEEPRVATFQMRTVGFPLDIWWFDADGALLGNAEMQTCPDGACTSYASPGAIMWALETPMGAVDFTPGATLEFP